MPKTTSKTRRPAGREEATVTPSSGNVFADLGLRDADELLAKADLAHAIQERRRSVRAHLQHCHA